MGRTPIRKTEVKAPTHNRVRLRKNASQRSLLDLPADIVAKIRDEYGSDLQWVTDQVLGKDEPAIRQDFEINGWEPVNQAMFDGLLDGMYMKKGQGGEIRYNGLVLMERPYELTEQARSEEAAARIGAMEAQRAMIKNGVIPGMSAGFEPDHPTAIGRNVFKRSVERPADIPTE